MPTPLDLSTLNPQQKEAVTHDTGPLLIIAGAGTGKTTVVTKRIQHLILEKKVQPSHILALTFTEKAAAEMETRIDESLPYGYSNLWIETFHAFCDRILRQEAIHIGLNPGYELLTEAEGLLFLKKNLFKFDLNYFRPLGNPMKFLQGMIQHFSRLKDDDITTEQYLEYAKKLQTTNYELPTDAIESQKITELANAYQVYEQLKTKAGVMDFSDLISNTLKLFRMRPNILQNYQNQFEHILVDEFQDTNYAQNEMAILLSGEKKNIAVVGDDDQSIYRWRGAAIANMMQFRSHFPKAKVVALTQNYRSTQTILDHAYQLIQNNNPDRLEVKEGIEKRLIASRDSVIARSRSDEAIPSRITNLSSNTGNGVEFIYTTNAEDEAEQVAKVIKQEMKQHNRSYNDFAILVRANDHAQPFVRSLERAKIPYQFLGPGHLFQQEEIKDLIAYLKVLANFEDAASLYRILCMPIFNLEARDIAAMMNQAKRQNLSLFEVMERIDDMPVTEKGKEKTKRLVEIIQRHLGRVPKDTAGQLLYYFFEDSGLMGFYLDPQSMRTEKEAQNVAKFFEKLQSYASNHDDASVFAVIDWLDLSMELGESPLSAEVDWTNNNAVNILTVHSSKGLEFPVVFVVNLVTQRFPSRDRKEQIPVPNDLIREELPSGDENLQEERRLFYVAITRARDQLYLTASKFYGEGRRERKLSPFVIETLGEDRVNSIIKKHNIQSESQQLTLLDMFNENVENQTTQQSQTKEANSPTSHTLPPITYVSYSQIQTFDTCPLHYKLRYVLNFPSPDSPALSYGISVHSALRDYFMLLTQDQPINANTLQNILQKNWMKQGYSSKQHEQQAYQSAEKLLQDIVQKTADEKPNPIAMELPFNFWLVSPKQSEGGINNLKIGGRIDRIDQLPDGRIEIIDYKTGRNVPDEKKLAADMQLTFYALAANQVRGFLQDQRNSNSSLSERQQVEGQSNFQTLKKYPGLDPKEVVLSLYYVEENKKLTTTRTIEQLEEAKQFILDKVEAMKTSDFHCSHSRFCNDCEYKMLCSSS